MALIKSANDFSRLDGQLVPPSGLFKGSHRGVTRSGLAPIISQSRWYFVCVSTLPHHKCEENSPNTRFETYKTLSQHRVWLVEDAKFNNSAATIT